MVAVFPPVAVTRCKQGFKKCIGKRRGEDGARVQPAIFWFTNENERQAMEWAGLIAAIYEDRIKKGMGPIPAHAEHGTG